MPGRTIAGQRYPGDDGAPDPAAAAALAAYAAGQGSEHAALLALASVRLLVPVVAVLTEEEREPAPGGVAAPGGEPAPGGKPAARDGGAGQAGGRAGAARLRREKTSEMALPMLLGRDGRPAVLAFTCRDALARWRPGARPVAVPAAQVWQAGAEEASAVVIDVAGPVPLAVEGARLAALAAGQPPPPPHEDPDLLAAARAAVSGEPLLAAAALQASSQGGDLAVRVVLAAGCDPAAADVREAVQRAASQVFLAAGGRLRRGVEVTVSGAGPP